MRTSSSTLSMPVLFLSALMFCLLGCGHSNRSSVGPVTAVTLSPSAVSLTAGDVLQMQVIATDAAGHSVFNQTLAFSSSNPAIQVATSGLLCGGTWKDASGNPSLTNPITCTPEPLSGSADTTNLTVSVQGKTSNTVVATVHPKITSVVVTPIFSGATCSFTDGFGRAQTGVSQNGTVQFSATAKDSGGNPVNAGSFTWTISDSTVGTLAVTSTTGSAANTVTAKLPGTATVVASANSVNPINSVAVNFAECPVGSIAIPSNAFSPSPAPTAGTTFQLAPTVKDILGVAVAGATLTYNTSVSAVASVGTAGLVTAVAPGAAGITASCTPNSCNKNLNLPVYSNVAVASVAGSTSNPAVYVASTTSSSVVLISNNSVSATTITIPSSLKPNSLVFNPAGTKAYLGTSGGLVTLDAASNTVTSPITNAAGKVLAVSPNGQFIVVAGTTQLLLFDQTANTVTGFSVTNATAAEFTPDNNKIFVVNGSNNLFILQQGTTSSFTMKSLGTTGNDVSVLANGSLGYVATTGTVSEFATCNNTPAVGPAGGNPTLVKTLPDGSQMLGADPTASSLDTIAVNITSTGCPPVFTDPLTAQNLGAAFTVAHQLIVTPNSKHAYITSDLSGKLLRFDFVGPNATPITLASAVTTTTGGSTPDSATVYVGGSDNNVHKIDVATGVDTLIPVTIAPEFVAVRP